MIRLFIVLAVLWFVLVDAPSKCIAGPADTDFTAFIVSNEHPERIAASKEQLVYDGITLKKLVALLGPGWMSPLEGAGVISWEFDDRTLYVWPRDYKPDEILTFDRKGMARMRWSTPPPGSPK